VAVLVIGGSGGSKPSYLGQALACERMAALSVAYFARPELPAQLRDIPLEHFSAALEIPRDAQPSLSVPLAVAGMSRRSEAAMLTAVRAPDRGPRCAGHSAWERGPRQLATRQPSPAPRWHAATVRRPLPGALVVVVGNEVIRLSVGHRHAWKLIAAAVSSAQS
jgi:hypothetical protein